MRVSYRPVQDLHDVQAWARELDLRSVVFDVEPLVALWDTDEETLRAGVDAATTAMRAIDSIQVVGFATNSRRDLPVHDAAPVRVYYNVAAGKPLRTRPYRSLPRPAGLIGDQIATDGVLARRLGFAFAHVQYANFPPPRGPRLMAALGRPMARWLFAAA